MRMTYCVIMILVSFLLLTGEYHRLRNRAIGLYRRLTFKRSASVFENSYLETKVFYLHCFRRIPSTSYISGVDIPRAFAYIRKTLRHRILETYQSNYFDREEGRQASDRTIFVLSDQVLVELRSSSVKILYPDKMSGFADSLIKAVSEFREPEKEEDFEINIVSRDSYGLTLKTLEVKPTVLDIDLYYNDDFKMIDQVIKKRLSENGDKGVVLLHGLPGTGKTTYLRHLIGSLKKRVLLLSPNVAVNLMDPEFVDLLIDNPNAVLLIEDAENIMMDRSFNANSSVSNLLNLSDGLLSDCVNVQIICTFNSSLNLIDPALMRKGRLIARYEFGKLTVEKAGKLSAELGFESEIREPMTLAEITGQNQPAAQPKKVEVIGFRRQEVAMN